MCVVTARAAGGAVLATLVNTGWSTVQGATQGTGHMGLHLSLSRPLLVDWCSESLWGAGPPPFLPLFS